MASSFRQPEYLSANDQPKCRIRCPVHGFIHYSENERRIIDHRLFRRLRLIRQLGLTELLYPGATHTRFEHSLGVMHVATLAFDRLALANGDVFEETFKKVEGFEDDTLAKARQVLRLTALLHDVGHAPFSHAVEHIIHKNSSHEDLTIEVLEKPHFLGSEIDEIFFEGCSQAAANIIRGDPALPPQLKVLGDIVSGQMDADRTDYLLRDSLHCGVDYGRFDYRRMIECLELFHGPGDSLEIALNRGGIHTFEALILARYQMNAQVYFHRIRRIYDLYLEKYFKAMGGDRFGTAEKILEQNDVTMMALIFDDASRGDEKVKHWARRIVERDHHKVIHQTGEMTNATDLNCSKNLFKDLEERFPDTEFLWDHASARIHSLQLPNDMSDEGCQPLWVVDNVGGKKLLGEQSHILRHVPKRFQIARIFSDLGDGLAAKRKEIEDWAKRRYQEQGGR